MAKKFYSRTGEAVETKGTCKQVMIHDGRFLKSEFTFGSVDAAVSGLGIVGYDPKTDRFTSFWTDSRSTRISIRASKGPFNGRQLVLFSRSLDEAEKDTRSSKTVTQLEEDGNVIRHQQYAPGSSRRGTAGYGTNVEASQTFEPGRLTRMYDPSPAAMCHRRAVPAEN